MSGDGSEEEPELERFWFGNVRRFWDVILLLIWTLAAVATVSLPVNSVPILRVLAVAPLVLFIPGYLLMAALVPCPRVSDTTFRCVLATACSIIVTPLIGIGLFTVSGMIRWETLVFWLAVIILVLAAIVGIRRTCLPPSPLFWPVMALEECGEKSDNGDLPNGQNILVLAGIILIAVIVFGALIVISLPGNEEQFTEFYLIGKNGTLDRFPAIITPNTPYPISLGITNHEHRNVNYSVSVILTGKKENESTLLCIPVGTFNVSLGHDQNVVIPLELSVPDNQYSGVDFLLEKDEAAARGQSVQEPGEALAYRSLHLVLNITPR